MNNSKFPAAVLLSLFLAGIVPAQAATRTWVPTTGTTNNWFDKTNWSPNDDYPRAGDNVVITNAGAAVLLTNSTEYLVSIVISNTATLIFSNWNTTLSATNVYIRTNAIVTLPPAFTTNAGGVMSNNVYIICSNLTIDAGGNINADGKGWAGGTNSTGGSGPGRGVGSTKSAGYGGWGGGSDGATYGLTYGSATNPFAPGSGGDNDVARPSYLGKAGGGAIRIEATGPVTVNGTITAKGDDSVGQHTGAGSGGGIYIACSTMQGAGVVRADGGNGTTDGPGGGGGRIGVLYNTNLQTSVTPAPTIQFTAAPGSTSGIKGGGVTDLGTLYFPDTQILSAILPHNGQLIIPGWTNWVVNNLTITNGWIRIPVDGFRLNVTGNLRIDGLNGKLELGGSQNAIHVGANWHIWNATNGCTLTCGGNLVLTNSGRLTIYSGLTDATKTNSSLVQVGGALQISPGSWIYPVSHPTNGGSVKFRVGDLTIPTNAGINANSAGFSGGWVNTANGYGPGGGVGYAGGYGGAGGVQNVTYGSISAPVEPGSGGCAGTANPGNAGGLVRIESSGNVVVNGMITANGADCAGYGSAPGSGGGVYIICNTFSGTRVGTNGMISANGGFWGDNGGGGGGRIAIVYTNAAAQGALPKPSVVFSCARGTGNGGATPGEIGTIYFPDTQCLNEIMPHTGQLIVAGWTNWAPNTLTITNGWVRFPAEGFRLSVSNDVIITGAGSRLDMGGNRTPYIGTFRHIYTETIGPTLTCGGNLILTNSGSLYIYSGMAARSNYGATVVTRDVYVNSNCWIYPVSHPTNGGSVLFQMRNLTIPATNAGFNANFAGYISGKFTNTDNGVGYGPGGSANAGGSYGGRGGGFGFYGAAVYGSSNAPVEPGSGGGAGSHNQGSAGGLIRIDATGVLTLNGFLTANGMDSPNNYNGGGSGGGIYVTCRRFAGLSGIVSATGGTGGSGNVGGGGGGGRIAIWRISDLSSGVTATAAGGLGTPGSYYSGEVGTIVWGWIPPPGTVFTVH